MGKAAGPLGKVLTVHGHRLRYHGRELGCDANALIVLRRLAFLDDEGKPDLAQESPSKQALLRWAVTHCLGQQSQFGHASGQESEEQAEQLLNLVIERRKRALQELLSRGYITRRLTLRPAWRLVVGLGEQANPYEIGLSLHGTYGWPIIPGSTLKGLTRAWALASGKSGGRIQAIFGEPPPPRGEPETTKRASKTTADGQRAAASLEATEDTSKAAQGTVRFLDALPAEPVSVTHDVLTPHVQPYYHDTAPDSQVQNPWPPGEYHNPIPVRFLTLTQGSFAVDLVGRDAANVKQAATWCQRACQDLGVGGKTSAGYGYLLWGDDQR